MKNTKLLSLILIVFTYAILINFVPQPYLHYVFIAGGILIVIYLFVLPAINFFKKRNLPATKTGKSLKSLLLKINRHFFIYWLILYIVRVNLFAYNSWEIYIWISALIFSLIININFKKQKVSD